MDATENPLNGFGYTPREAAFLRMVAVHSGAFMRRHYVAYTQTPVGKAHHLLVSKLLERGHGRAQRFQDNGDVYHLTHKPIYRAFGVEDSNNRKSRSLTVVKARLMALDLVLAHAEARFLETEADKIGFFRARYGLSAEQIPAATYVARRSGAAMTRRWFIEKYPIFLTGEKESPFVNFSFINDGQATLSSFANFLHRYAPIFGRIESFRLFYVSERRDGAAAAREYFGRQWSMPAGERAMRTAPPATEPSSPKLRLFQLMRAWDRDRKSFNNAMYQEMVALQKQFQDVDYEAEFRAWMTHPESVPSRLSLSRSAPVVEALGNREPRRRFEWLDIGRRYDFLWETVLAPARLGRAWSHPLSPALSPSLSPAASGHAAEARAVTTAMGTEAGSPEEQPTPKPPAGNDPVVTGFGPAGAAKVPARQDRA